MVAIDRQPFLQAQLEPVAAGDAVAGPVVEILMRDDGFDIGVIGVGGGFGIGQDILVVEDIEPLVLHGAHVEIGTATIWKMSRSYSRPKASSSHFIERLSASIA
jgi:ABC-type cobalamin transport system permease subunit